VRRLHLNTSVDDDGAQHVCEVLAGMGAPPPVVDPWAAAAAAVAAADKSAALERAAEARALRLRRGSGGVEPVTSGSTSKAQRTALGVGGAVLAVGASAMVVAQWRRRRLRRQRKESSHQQVYIRAVVERERAVGHGS